jgi:hypothetical protein
VIKEVFTNMAEAIIGGELERERRRYAGLLAAIGDEWMPGLLPLEQSRRFFEFGVESHEIAADLERAGGSDDTEPVASREEQATSAAS